MTGDAGPGGRRAAGPRTSGAAELASRSGLSPVKALHRLVELAALTLPGCSGATSTAWRNGQLLLSVASHPDLAWLLEAQLASGAGPELEAIRTGESTSCPDTLSARDWPDYAANALRVGIRCSQTLVHRRGGLSVTLSLYGARRRALATAGTRAASLLAAVGVALLADAVHYDDARGTALHLREAIELQSVVEQAKGLLMHALGCDEQQAVARLREMSRDRNITIPEMARLLIGEQPGA